MSDGTRDANASVQRVALLGSPNAGKTSVFNRLTGMRRKVGNYPGVTVERIEATLRDATHITLLDLPGTYALEALSADEAVTRDVLFATGDDAVDAVLLVLDATTLARSLPMAAQVLRSGLPAGVVVTMIDELKAAGGRFDAAALERALGVPVFGVVGNRGVGLDRVVDAVRAGALHPSYAALPEDGDEFLLERVDWARETVASTVERGAPSTSLTERVDAVLLHRVWGVLSFALVMTVFFQLIFVVAAPIQDVFEGAVLALGAMVESALPEGWLRGLLVDGVIAGVGGVVVFVPQIAILLLLVALMEASGYMARAAFLMDRLMGWVGLEGRSFVALLSSYACAVPGIMATRTVPDPRARMSTILVAPLMTCSARLPVYTLLIAAFVPQRRVLGVLSLQGLTMLGLYLAGAFSALLVAAVFQRFGKRSALYPFYMELPPYRRPMALAVLHQVKRGVVGFLRKAGTVILGVAVLLWVLFSVPAPGRVPPSVGDPAAELALEDSAAAWAGHALEPVLSPLGYDWRLGVGIIASFAAREVIVSTLSQVYAMEGDGEDVAGLAERLQQQRAPDGTPAYSLATALSLLAFYVFALQCVSTLAVIRRETGGWRWPALAFGYTFALAYGSAWVTYRVALAAGLG